MHSTNILQRSFPILVEGQPQQHTQRKRSPASGRHMKNQGTLAVQVGLGLGRRLDMINDRDVNTFWTTNALPL